MAVRSNGFYNDPALGQAFENLAAIFAPPSGADTAGYATAAAKKAEASRLAALFAQATDPSTSRETIDRYGIGAGVYNPNQSYYSVDQGNVTSRDNNAADNTRALEVAKMDEAGKLARQFAAPVLVNEGQTAFLPKQTATATGLPDMFAGNISTNPGETVLTPDGRTIAGTPKPLTETEMQAIILGKLPPSEQRAIALQGVPVETVAGDGGRPTIVQRQDAVGKEPVADPTKAQVANYKTAGGKTGTAVFDPVLGWKDSQTGEKLPPGATTYGATLSGDAASTGLGDPTTANRTVANNSAAEVTTALNTLDLYEGLVRQNPGAIGLPSLIRGTAQDAVASASDFAQSFGKTTPEVEELANSIRNGLQRVAPDFFDPSIPEAAFYRATIAYAIARTENPSGEVSRQAFERAEKRIGGGMLANTQSVLAEIGTARKVLKQRLTGIDTLRDPATARTDTGFKPPATGETTVENWERDPATGKMRKVQ